DRSVQKIVEQAKLKGHIKTLHGLPFQGGISDVRIDDRRIARIGGQGISWLGYKIIPKVVIAHFPIGSPELQLIDPGHIGYEILLVQPPGGPNGIKGSPTGFGTEYGGAVTPNGTTDVILVVEVVVRPEEIALQGLVGGRPPQTHRSGKVVKFIYALRRLVYGQGAQSGKGPVVTFMSPGQLEIVEVVETLGIGQDLGKVLYFPSVAGFTVPSRWLGIPDDVVLVFLLHALIDVPAIVEP